MASTAVKYICIKLCVQTRKANMKSHHSRVSHNFKIAMVILLFVLTLLRLGFLFLFPNVEIISDKVLLSVVLFVVAYLWMQEVIDYHNLLFLNEELKESQEKLKEAEIDAITALVKAVEAKDYYTSGHSDRVTSIALAIAEEMRLSNEEKKTLGRAGALHDIGKISISDTILTKKEKLTEEDWKIIKGHPDIAVRILKPLKFLKEETEIIYSHHERYDGKGYPRGLKGDNIPLLAQILSVADTFDAMNSKRPYRDALSKEKVVSELYNSRQTQHSPEVVDSFLHLLMKSPQFWEEGHA